MVSCSIDHSVDILRAWIPTCAQKLGSRDVGHRVHFLPRIAENPHLRAHVVTPAYAFIPVHPIQGVRGTPVNDTPHDGCFIRDNVGEYLVVLPLLGERKAKASETTPQRFAYRPRSKLLLLDVEIATVSEVEHVVRSPDRRVGHEFTPSPAQRSGSAAARSAVRCNRLLRIAVEKPFN